MKSKKKNTVGLEAELLRLNQLVRARRHQLSRLDDCPHSDCECRAVWHEVVEKNLKSQVGKVRRSVRGTKTTKASKSTKATKTTKKAKRG